MKDVEEILSELASQGFEGIISPTTEDRLGKRGIHIPKPPKLTLEQSIDLIFSEARKQKALGIAKTLPQSPDIPVPSIQSLYNEIREAIILGLNGAAITLCGILVEHVLKYATYKVEIGGFAKYDSAKADEFERFALGSAIDRAAKAGLLTPDDIDKLRYFKDTYRNPYNHYNLKKITSNYYIEEFKLLTQTLVRSKCVTLQPKTITSFKLRPNLALMPTMCSRCLFLRTVLSRPCGSG